MPPRRRVARRLAGGRRGNGQTEGGAETTDAVPMAHYMVTMQRLSDWGLFTDILNVVFSSPAPLRASTFEEAVRSVLRQMSEEFPTEFEHIREVAGASWPPREMEGEAPPIHPFDERAALRDLPHDVRRAVTMLAGKYAQYGYPERQALQHALVESMDDFPSAFAAAGRIARDRERNDRLPAGRGMSTERSSAEAIEGRGDDNGSGVFKDAGFAPFSGTGHRLASD